MAKFYHFLVFIILAFTLQANAQNLSISIQPPDNLYVCGSDQANIVIQNGGPAINSGQLSVDLPQNVAYVAGTITGAAELNISNANAPIFSLGAIPAGGSITVTLTVTAPCALIDAINSGQLFQIEAAASANGNTQTALSNAFPIETGLVLIASVTPPSQTAIFNQVVTRNIKVRNTRQGPISSLSFSDNHDAGLSMELAGIGGQNPIATFFTATVPDTYFSNFGDGDNLFEFNEEITLTENITILDCGDPSVDKFSDIRVGWGCGNTVCQWDSIAASITIVPSVANPNLQFIPVFAVPQDQCAAVPAFQEMLIVNNSNVQATDVSVLLVSGDSSRLAIANTNISTNDGSGWLPASVTGSTPVQMTACGVTYYNYVSILVPLVLPGDTVRLRFPTYYCQSPCGGLSLPTIGAVVSYPKACPPDQFFNAAVDFFATAQDTVFKSDVYYNIGNCIEDQQYFNMNWWTKSNRLLASSGFIQFELELPWGMFWDMTCLPQPEGKLPVMVVADTMLNQSIRLRLTYALPFSSDSIYSDFCLYNICQDPGAYVSGVPNPPGRGMSLTLYPVPTGCSPCEQIIETRTAFIPEIDTDINCGISACNRFTLVLNCGCEGNGGGGGGPAGGLGGIAVVSYDSYRLNLGLKDDDDNRVADAQAPPTLSLIRRDRFLPGDTMRTDLKGVVVAGAIDAINFRLFAETWASDFGVQDGDPIDIFAASKGFTNYDSLAYLGAQLFVHIAATGQNYECPIPGPGLRNDQLYIKIAEPNIRPDVIYEEIASMFHQYNVSLAALASTGCLPAGTVLTTGDSLLIRMDHKFKQNFIPNAPNFPPLINFRSSICGTGNIFAWRLDNCLPALLRQYSGYYEELLSPAINILACTPSQELVPFRYQLRIARGNLFPYEVRTLATINEFTQTLPLGVALTLSRLNYLRLQENVPVLNNDTLSAQTFADYYRINLANVFGTQLDEGFKFEINTQYGPYCGPDQENDMYTRLNVQYANECFRDPVSAQLEAYSPNGFLNGSAMLSLIPTDTVLKIGGSSLQTAFKIRNAAGTGAPNAWLVIESDGYLQNIDLVFMPSGQPVPLVGGVYQLGALGGFQELSFQMNAENTSCETIIIRFRYGWDCDPFGNPLDVPCGDFVKVIELQPQLPELELVIRSQPPELPMCALSDYFVFEVYNANEGLAFGIAPSIKLPSGIEIEPGTSQYAYPSGGAWLNLPNPAQLPGNIYQWNPNAVSTTLAQNGLQGVQETPLNSILIRFKVRTECGLVSNAQPIYGAEAILPCGIASNVLRKPGAPLLLAGLPPAYTVQALLQLSGSGNNLGCGDQTVVGVKINLGGDPGPLDSIYLILPAGVSYVPGSFQGVQNAPSQGPVVSGNTLQWPIPANAGIGTDIRFNISLRYDDPAGCDDKIVILQARQKAEIFCPSLGQNCNVYIATGEFLLPLNFGNPDLTLLNFATNLQNGVVNFSALLENLGSGTANSPQVQFYNDLNGNGQIDPGEPQVGSFQSPQNIAPGGTGGIQGALTIDPTQICALLAFIPGDENCACADRLIPLDGNIVIASSIGLCTVAPVNVGVNAVPGHTYLWLTNGDLSCINCPSTVYTPSGSVSPGDLITLVLQETGGTCTIEHRFDIQFGGVLGILTPDQVICEGNSVKMEATPGGSYQWSGPGISAPGNAIQFVQPPSTQTYSVTVTFADGCTGADQITVTVNPIDSTLLPDIETCPGQPVAVPGAVTDQPGFYALRLNNQFGCDSVVIQQLRVPNTQTTQTVPLCQGDSLQVFGAWVMNDTVRCQLFTSAAGCDSTHCITVSLVDPPMTEDVTAGPYVEGQQITLDQLGGYTGYQWSPPTGLSCTDCEAPTFTPDSSQTFLVVVTDGNGCPGQLEYRILVYPPCGAENLNIPNAFSPNGDGVNDVFRIVPFEGFEVLKSMEVFNRWGRKIYAGAGNSAQWDGMINGQPAPSDVYIWMAEIQCDNKIEPIKGEITLLR